MSFVYSREFVLKVHWSPSSYWSPLFISRPSRSSLCGRAPAPRLPTFPPVEARVRVHRVYCDTADSRTRPRQPSALRSANGEASTFWRRTASPVIGRCPLHLWRWLAACYQPPDRCEVCFSAFSVCARVGILPQLLRLRRSPSGAPPGEATIRGGVKGLRSSQVGFLLRFWSVG